MPFLRVLRDKRGYETTFLMHWFRDGTRQRSRILYVFRTPPGVRVGRHIFEASTIQEIESQHPDIEFDWRSLVDNQQIVETAPELRRPRKRRKDGDAATSATGAAGSTGATGTASGATGVPEAPDAPAAPAARVAPVPPDAPVARAAPRHVIPSVIEGSSQDEQIAWLRTWYPVVRERVPHRTHDPVRREALFALAERLNPDPWSSGDAIAQGLKDAADALMRLSRVFAKRRRRSRRGAAKRDGGGNTTPAGSNGEGRSDT